MSAAFTFAAREIVSYCKLIEESDPQNHSLNSGFLEDLIEYNKRMDDAYRDLCLSATLDPAAFETIAATYQSSRKTFVHTRAILQDSLEASNRSHLTSTQILPAPSNNDEIYLKVPPCDTEVFYGGYEEWPSFRDMFTAVYANHPKLSSVQKLYHLRNKTRGRAGAIVKSYPLSEQNFNLAWDALKAKYENKRVLVDNQLKILFSMQTVLKENSEEIQKIQSTINDCLNILTNHGVNVRNWDPILIYLACTKLPNETLALWEQSLQSHKELPSWTQMDIFLTNRYEVVERLCSIKEIKQPALRSENKHIESFVAQESASFICNLCNVNHSLRQCPIFEQLSVHDKISYVNENNYCANCLAYSHTKDQCRSKYHCSICRRQHHTKLHIPRTRSPRNIQAFKSSQTPPKAPIASVPTLDVSSETPSSSPGFQSYVIASNSQILLPTALVQIRYLNKRLTIRSLIDQGSQRSFISEKIQKQLQLPTTHLACQISGIGGQSSQTSDKECTFALVSPKNTFSTQLRAVVLKKLTNWLPSTPIENLNLNDIKHLDLADPNFTIPGTIDLVLGSDIVPQILLDGIKHNIFGSLLAQKSVFGWYLSGPLLTRETTFQSFAVESNEEEDAEPLDELIKRFWETEEVPRAPEISPEDAYCEELYLKTTYRKKEGKYVVKLPFRIDFPEPCGLGSSKPIAAAQFSRMESKLLKQPELAQTYNNVLKEYLTLGHMQRVAASHEVSENGRFLSYYLPHHSVLRPESKTTKVRIVFNASQKTSSSLSLNDVLYPGPVLQADLVVMILNWRSYRFVFNGDIEKMYRQILVHESDRSFQRILFRENPNEPLKDYQLNTVTFGVNCAPYLAIRTLLQLAHENEETAPLAASILKHETYVDDVLAGGHTLGDALEAQKQLISTLKTAGFPLKKSTANHPDLLKDISPSDLLDSQFLKFETTSNAKMLGIRWNALYDSFSYKLAPISTLPSATKRKIVSQVSKIFDPTGFCTPIMIQAKSLIQQLWLEGLKWDEEVQPDMLMKYNTLIEDLKLIEDVQIPRWTHYGPTARLQIHGFCDASERAYCAAIYLRVEQDDQVFSNLLVAKSKVAPLQTISLPRLELCGAVLLSKLIKNVLPQLRLHEYETFLWTDSSIVIGWLKRPPSTWKTYVANRVSQVLSNVGNVAWRHVVSRDNPADLGTRGCTTQELKINTLWWNGPKWLLQPIETWPRSLPIISPPPELRHISSFLSISQSDDPLNRFSSLDRASRVLAYVFRFSHLAKNCPVAKFESLSLTQNEIQAVKLRLIQISQKIYYGTEYHCLEIGRPVCKKSSLSTLNPFLDANKIIRANGRLANADLPYDQRFPIILPSSSRFCSLFMEFMHKILLHGEIQLMMRMIRQHFYIPRLKQKVKKCIYLCKTCTIYKQRTQAQLMAALPSERSTFSLPFTNTGVDFAGPFQIKSSPIRNAPYLKGYACIFVCFSTKAVHLEACEDLSTAAFLDTFIRFVGRRGLPKRIFSDNGKNFVGAKTVLETESEIFTKQLSATIQAKYAVEGCEWHFIPPYAPHMGGLWEAAVKSVKIHFQKVAGSHKFTFQQFSTLLVRIEGVLNSRPLTPQSEDPDDLLALTPGEILHGRPLMAFPETLVEDSSVAPLPLEKIKVLHHRFCQRWKDEYLSTLHKRYKWKQPDRNLELGDFVVVRDDQLTPSDWRMGRIVKLYFGLDNLVRVADIRTQMGVITRDISKLCPLPFQPEYFH